MALQFSSLLVVLVSLLTTAGCLFPNSKGPNDGKTADLLASAPSRCFDFEPIAVLNGEVPHDAWLVTLHELNANGELADAVVGFGKSDQRGLAHVCVKTESALKPLMAKATHVGVAQKLRRYIPTNATAEILVIDNLTTHLSNIVLDIHRLSLSGPIDKVRQEDFREIEQALRAMPALETLEDVATAYGKVVGDQASIGAHSACLNSPFAAGSFTVGEPFAFVDGHPERFSPLGASALRADGTLDNIAGQAIENKVWIINDVNLYEHPGKTVSNLNAPQYGAQVAAHGFDLNGQLNASLTWFQLHNGKDATALLPCIAGVMTVQNEGLNKSRIKRGPTMCFSVEGNKPMAKVEPEFATFGDEDRSGSLVLTLPGIRDGALDDGLRLETRGGEVCIAFARDRELAARTEMGDMASILFTICNVATGSEAVVSARMHEASRPQLEAGLLTYNDNVTRDGLAQQIGRADFINNPNVISFLKADVRDSLINFNQGYKTNVFVSGKGLNQEYTLLLNGTGAPIATIRTGPQGQFSGGLRLPAAKEGDFIRFISPGRHFDVTLETSCVNNARAL